MQLIHTLTEASSIPIDDLKKVMSKDARVKAIFTKNLELDSITNRAEFLATLKFFLLNNRNVIEFVEGRDYVKAVDKRSLKRLREVKPLALKQSDIDDLQEFVTDLFREHAYVERSGMSASLRKEILDWVNANGRYFSLSASAQKELKSLPGLRPTRPILLYRGLLFSSYDLKERKRYDGQLEVGAGLKFLRSIKEGSRVVDLEWDRASSWSTSRQTAAQFAQFSSANSNFEATMNWLHNSGAGNKIHGELGFIVSTLAQPDDVLIDVSRMVTAAHMKHGNEGEIILKPGTYKCRVNTKYSKSEGEVDPIGTSKIDDGLQSAIVAVQEFSSTWATSSVWDDLVSEDWASIDAQRLLNQGKLDEFGILARASTKDAALKAYGELRDFYLKHIDPLSQAQIESLVAHKEFGKLVDWMAEVRKKFHGQTAHPAFKSPSDSKGRTKVKELSPEQKRESGFSTLAKDFGHAAAGARFTDYSIAASINALIKGFGGEHVTQLQKMKGADQQKHVNGAIDSFYKHFGMEQPADREEAVRKMKSALLGAERNAGLINFVVNVRSELNDALGS